jgi:prepilin-type N-terminal cleavage/methylation domain-containing protein
VTRWRGFSLIEVLISVVIFSTVILGLAGLAFQIARHSTRATDQALVLSALVGRVDRASSVPFDSLPSLARCDTTVSGAVQIRGCTSVTPISPRVVSITVIVSTSVPGGRADTVVFQRSRVRNPLPLR